LRVVPREHPIESHERIAALRGRLLAELAAEQARQGRRLALLAKRTVDVGTATLALLLLAPLLLAVAVAVAIGSRGPIIFRQERVGQGGRMFRCFKFRTMVANAEQLLLQDAALRAEYAVAWKLERDPRITRVGAFLRQTSLDELPQLLNVIKGDMSIVGPRPIQAAELREHYTAEEAAAFCSVKPGLTGLWQVSGRSSLTYDERVSLELAYVDRQGFWYDLGIVFRTVPALLLRRGAV
jgi:lipopolysaccharide/colanic/teichoic acid biosynthesis glycosyltransferase